MNCLRLCRLAYRLPITNPLLISSATYSMRHPLKFMESEDRWREQDNLPRNWELIYKAPMEKWLKILSAYLTVSTTSVALGGLYYGIFEFRSDTMNEPVLLSGDILIANSAMECLVYVGAFVAFHAATKIVLSKYVIRIYQDGDNYLAIFRGHTYNSIYKHKFHLNDFEKVNPRLAVGWSDARYLLGTKSAIILDYHFKTPAYYNYLLNKRGRDDPNRDEDD